MPVRPRPAPSIGWLHRATRYLFFTGKGGVGKTSLSAATALALADTGRLVTLPEATPVSQAAALQDELRRARIEPHAWVLTKSLLAGKRRQVDRLVAGLARRLPALPFLTTAPVGVAGLSRLVAAPATLPS